MAGFQVIISGRFWVIADTPMPVDVFQKLLDQCHQWQQIDAKQILSTTQRGCGERLQAQRKQRDGVQFEAVLRLALNAGLDRVDIERVTWSHLRLDATVPHLRLARGKVQLALGEAIERITPLLPSTVHALRTWWAFESSSGSEVFRNARKKPYRSNDLSKTLQRLRDAAGADSCWSFKHLRNVGPTLARRAKLTRDERDAFLGHVVAGTSKFYEGDVDETYLIPLVNLIGRDYVHGEQIQPPAE